MEKKAELQQDLEIIIQPRQQSGSWQLISAGVNREECANQGLIQKKRLRMPKFARASLPMIFALQDARDSFVGCAEFEFAWIVFFWQQLLALCGCVRVFSNVWRSWRFEERCTAVLFRLVMVMSVYAAAAQTLGEDGRLGRPGDFRKT